MGASEDSGSRTVIVGYDGSPGARDALALGRVLADALDARPIIATVVLYPDHLIGAQEVQGIAARQAAPMLAAAMDRVQDLEPETAVLVDDSPAHALHQLAEARRPIALVLGSSHRAPLGRVFLGSVGQSLLSGAPCAVAVAPRDYAQATGEDLRRIGVGLNGSRESWSAFSAATSLAERLDAGVTAIAVAEPPHYGYGATIAVLTATEYESAQRRHATEVLAEAAQRAPARVSMRRLLLNGMADSELEHASRELDLLVVGSRGYGPLRRALLGGVTARLMHRVACPLLVLTRGAGEDPLRLQVHVAESRLDHVSSGSA